MDEYDIFLIGEIGDDALVQTLPGEDPPIIGPKFLRKELNKVPPKAKRLNIHIQSPGGEVDSGFTMYDQIKEFKRRRNIQIHTFITGFVKSIATVPFLAGDQRFISPAAVFMIHNPWSMGIGDADQLQELADDVRQAEDRLAKFYHEKTGFNMALIKAKMKNETEFTMDEAIRYGFATDELEDEQEDPIQELIQNRANKVYAHGVAYFNKSKKQMKKPKAKTAGNSKETRTRVNTLVAKLGKLLNLTGDETIKNLELELEGGDLIFTDAEDPEALENFGAWSVDADGNPVDPLPDGDYTLADGRVITVAEGMISAVAAAPEETTDEQLNNRMDQIEDMLDKVFEALALKKDDAKKAKAPAAKPKAKATGGSDDNDDDDQVDLTDIKKDLKKVTAELVNIKKNMTSGGAPGTGKGFTGPPNGAPGAAAGSAWQRERNKLRGARRDPRFDPKLD